jgi:peptide/nickel transport system substrate-binding protein
VPGERIVAERNPHYFRSGEELPYFDEVIFRFLQGETNPVEAVNSGECDVIARDLLQAGDYGAYRAEADAGTLTLHAIPGTVWEHLDFGINPVEDYDWRGDFFQDRRVRQAAAHCIDRDSLVEETMAGLSAPLNAYIHPSHPLYAEAGLEIYPFDPERGIALLDEAGWRDTNGDGVAEAYGIERIANGTILAFNYTNTESAFRQQVAEMVRTDLAACGFRVYETESVPAAQFFANDEGSPVFGRRFDLTNFAWFADVEPPCHLYLSSQIPTLLNGWSGFNVTGYENEQYDTACVSSQATVPGMDAYRENHLEALRIFNQDLPAIPLFLHAEAALTRPDLEGFRLDPTEPAETWNIEEWRLTDS